MEPVRKILVVGGGSAGWITAALLRRALSEEVEVALVESTTIGTVSVGEATVPTIKPQVFDFLGLDEATWMPHCAATYKIGIDFIDWNGPGQRFYSILAEGPSVDGLPLTSHWLDRAARGETQLPLSHSCHPGATLCDQRHSPRFSDGTAAAPAAYHFDAGLVADYLKGWAVPRGVVHLVDRVVEVERRADGNIAAVVLEGRGRREADLFIDCSGFRGLLINDALGEPFVSYGDTLLCDRAVAINVPTPGRTDTPPYVEATAQSAGWTWDIPLWGRIGAGYVYASAFQNADDAERELRAFLKRRGYAGVDAIEARHLKMRVGRCQRGWVGNCVAIGLSSGFIEPLESTGIYTAHAAVHLLLRYFPDRSMPSALRDRFNEKMAFMFDDVMEFIALHYATNDREDTPFWHANRHEIVVPESLKRLLGVYHAGSPVRMRYSGEHLSSYSFDASLDRLWTNWNYVSVLAGKGRLPKHGVPRLALKGPGHAEAERLFAAIEAETAGLLRRTDSHHAWLKRLYR